MCRACIAQSAAYRTLEQGVAGSIPFSWLVERCFTPLSTVFQSYHGDSSHYSCLSWVSPALVWCSEVSCPRTLPRKNPEDPVRLEPRTPELQVKHFTTEPRRTTPPPRSIPGWANITFSFKERR